MITSPRPPRSPEYPDHRSGCSDHAAIADLDLFSPAFHQNPFAAYTRLRSRAPVAFHERTGLWLVSRYDDVLAVLLDDRTFASDNALTAVTRLSWGALRVLAAGRFDLPPSLANNGTDTHAGLRRLVGRFFDADNVAAAEPVVAELTRRRLALVHAELAAGRTVDLAQAIAAQVPCQVMLRQLDMTDIDGDTLVSWTQAALELFWGEPRPNARSRSPATPWRCTPGCGTTCGPPVRTATASWRPCGAIARPMGARSRTPSSSRCAISS